MSFIQVVQECLLTNPEDQLSDTLKNRLFTEWSIFWEKTQEIGFDPDEHRAVMINREWGDEIDYVIRDWVLTRNCEGAGFWDGGWHEPYATELTKLCREQRPIEIFKNEETNKYEPYV